MDASLAVVALRDLLDSDDELRTLMGTKSADTKVFVRNTLPESPQFPLLLISDFVYTPIVQGQQTQMYEAAIDVSIFAAVNSDGSDNLSYLCRMTAMIDRIVKASFKGSWYVSFRLQQAAATQTIDRYSVKVLTYQGKLSEVA